MSGAQPIGDEELAEHFAPLRRIDRLLVAVSSGADSVALLVLLTEWFTGLHPDVDASAHLFVATVDHGLRPESSGEAAWVGALARRLGLPHDILPWIGPRPRTGVQAAARQARYRLLVAAARRHGCDGIVTAHHLEDQAETVLLRLGHGSGIDGLSAMASSTDIEGVCLLRPLLAVSSARLRATLAARGETWLEDPSNTDPRFERVRLRQHATMLTGLGLTPATLASLARRADRARTALETAASDFIAAFAGDHAGAFCEIDRSAWLALPEEVALRVIRRSIWACGGQAEPARLKRVEDLVARLRACPRGSTFDATVGGCHIGARDETIVIVREPGRRGLGTIALPRGQSVVWDRRFAVSLAADCASQGLPDGVEVRALGAEGTRRLSAWRDSGKRRGMRFAWGVGEAWSRRVVVAVPALWRAGELVAVPHLSAPEKGWLTERLPLQGSCHCVPIFDHALRREWSVDTTVPS